MAKIKLYRGIGADSEEQLQNYIEELYNKDIEPSTFGGGANLGDGYYFTTNKEEAVKYSKGEDRYVAYEYSYVFEIEVDEDVFLSTAGITKSKLFEISPEFKKLYDRSTDGWHDNEEGLYEKVIAAEDKALKEYIISKQKQGVYSNETYNIMTNDFLETNSYKKEVEKKEVETVSKTTDKIDITELKNEVIKSGNKTVDQLVVATNYWEKRAIDTKLHLEISEEDYNKRLEAIYKQGSKDIEEKFAKFYAKFATDNNLTIGEAQQILPTSIAKEYKNDLQGYIEKAKSGDPKYYNYLLNQSVMHRFTALNTVQTEFREVIQNLDKNNTMGMYLNKTYQNGTYYSSFINNSPFTKVSQDKFEALLNENWSGGGNFSNSIWKNKEQLIQALDDIVITGLANGQSYNKMAELLAKRMDTSAKNAKRLIMTEAARIDSQCLLEQYKETGVEQFVIVATLDTKTSKICQSMDGQVFNIESAQLGLTIPPFHPYCRTTFAPYFEDNVTERAYRDKDTNKTKINSEYANYEQYLEKHLGDSEKAKALASDKNTLSNLLNSVTQVSEFKKILSNNVLTSNSDDINISNNNQVNTITKEEQNFIKEHLEEINEKIEFELDKETEKLAKELDEILKQMKYYNNEVYIELDENNIYSNMEIGEIFTSDTYITAIKENNIQTSKVIINSKTGKDAEYYLDDENYQVIFSRDSNFVIKEIKNEDGVLVYYVDEIIV